LRGAFTFRDSHGSSIAGLVRYVVTAGCAGSATLSTTVPLFTFEVLLYVP